MSSMLSDHKGAVVTLRVGGCAHRQSTQPSLQLLQHLVHVYVAHHSANATLADAHGEVKYNAWEKPTEVAKWKEEHVRITKNFEKNCGLLHASVLFKSYANVGSHHVFYFELHFADRICCLGWMGCRNYGGVQAVWRKEGDPRTCCRLGLIPHMF